MFYEFIDKKLYFDAEFSIGLSKYNHLIIEHKDHSDKLHSIVLFSEIVNYVFAPIEKYLLDSNRNKLTIYDKCDDGVSTKVYIDAEKINSENVILCQGNNIVVISAKLFCEITNEAFKYKTAK